MMRLSHATMALWWLILLCAFVRTAHADEFIGPLAGWANAKTNYGATGNGTTDDTTALQNALNDLGTGGHANVLYLPAGTYCISKTLTLASRIGVGILGADPATTTIKWTGGTTTNAMISVDGVAYSRYGRITWDGGGQAQTAWYDYWDGNNNYFPTRNEHADEVFQNVGYGIRVGQHLAGFGSNTGDAETAVLRCKFLNCSTAGVSIQDFNALDWFLWYCTFQSCGIGVTNNPPTGGAGNFHVYYSLFQNSSVADVTIGNTSYFSLRNNYSIGSKQFFVSSWEGNNSAKITLQRNTVLDATATPVSVSNAGPVMLIDNVFRSAAGQTGPVVQVGVGANQEDTLSVGNTYTVANPISAGGRIHTLGDQIVDRSTVNPAAPVLPGTLPNNNRKIFEVASTATDVQIQQAINAAALLNGQHPVVHVAAGNHMIAQTIQLPANTDVQLVGDGFLNATALTWAGAAGGTVLSLNGPSRATLRDLEVNGTGAATGIAASVADLPGDRVFIEQGDVYKDTQAGLQVSQLDNTLVELHDFYHDSSAGDSISVTANAFGIGRCDLYGGESSNSVNSYAVNDNGRLMAQDIWYEAHPTGASFLKLAGSGTFTLQGAHVATVTDGSTPVFDFDGFKGTASLLGIDSAANYSTQPSDFVIQSTTGSGADILALGIQGDNTTWFVQDSASVQYGFLDDKANDPSGSKQLPESGRSDAAFLLQTLAQTRTEYPSPSPLAATPAGNSDIQMYRVGSTEGAVNMNIGRVSAPVMDTDIGSPGQAGSGVNGQGVFTVKGGGSDIWGTSDQFHFYWRPLAGNGTMIARILSVQNTNQWAKVGVMFRNDLTASAPFADMVVTPGEGVSLQSRTKAGGQCGMTDVTGAAPSWVKLVRSGSTFTGYAAPDIQGAPGTWSLIATRTITMGSSIYAGLAVCAHNNAVINTSAFDHVTLTSP